MKHRARSRIEPTPRASLIVGSGTLKDIAQMARAVTARSAVDRRESAKVFAAIRWALNTRSSDHRNFGTSEPGRCRVSVNDSTASWLPEWRAGSGVRFSGVSESEMSPARIPGDSVPRAGAGTFDVGIRIAGAPFPTNRSPRRLSADMKSGGNGS